MKFFQWMRKYRVVVVSVWLFVAGAIGGVLATFVTHPFDVLKTRRQIDAKAETSTLSGMLRIEGLR
ncbi:MAG: MC/SLC25 family protein, partial [Deltaproteobacteria bacterium]